MFPPVAPSGSYAVEPADCFFEILDDQSGVDSVTPSASCQARKKLDPNALMGLNEPLLAGFARHFSPRRWHGFRLLATDGSKAPLPDTDEVIAAFDVPPEGSSVPLARFSRLYDVLNDLVIDADIASRNVGERVLDGEHLAVTREIDLLLRVAQAIAYHRYQARKHPYRVNFANALSKMKDNIVRLFVFDPPQQMLTSLVFAMSASVEAVRADRSFPQKIKSAKLHGFHPNYKGRW